MTYLKRHRPRRMPQSVPMPGPGQVPDSAGGFAWAVDDWTRLRRILVLGSEGGSHHASEWTLARENAAAVERCLASDGPRTVAETVRVSREGRAPANDPAILALAMAAGLGDEPTRRAALEALSEVCRTGTHIVRFAQLVEAFCGAAQPVDGPACPAVEYRPREGVSDL